MQTFKFIEFSKRNRAKRIIMDFVDRHHEHVTGDSDSQSNLVEPELLPPPKLSLKRRTCTGERHPNTSAAPQIAARCIPPDLLIPVFDEGTVAIIQGVLTPIIDKQVNMSQECNGSIPPLDNHSTFLIHLHFSFIRLITQTLLSFQVPSRTIGKEITATAIPPILPKTVSRNNE